MKKFGSMVLILLPAVFLLAGGIPLYTNEQPELKSRKEISSNILEKAGFKGSKQFGRWEHFSEGRLLESGNFPDGRELLREYETFRKNSGESLLESNWELLGPVEFDTVPDPLSSNYGRVNCIRFHPDDPGLAYIGTACGGMWKTSDRGESWEIMPFTQFLSIGISDIVLEPGNPDVIYALTGDELGGSLFRTYSIGIIKSTDAGSNWEIIRTASLGDSTLMKNLRVNPKNKEIIWVSTNKGVLISNDGGKSWSRTLDGKHVRDIEFHPENPGIAYASTYDVYGDTEIFRTLDAGITWDTLFKFDEVIRTEIEVSESVPDEVFALCADLITGDTKQLLYSTDAGDNWEDITPDLNDYNLIGWQGFFNLVFEVNPDNPDEIIAGGAILYHSTDRGNTWRHVTITEDDDGNYHSLHVDQHNAGFNPHDGMIYVCNDGGVFRGKAPELYWENISHGLSVTQFYRIEPHPFRSNFLYAGSQDNGLMIWDNGSWSGLPYGDVLDIKFIREKPNEFYFVRQRGNFHKSELGGRIIPQVNHGIDSYKPWLAPMLLHPENSDTIFFGFDVVWKYWPGGKQKVLDSDGPGEIKAMALNSKNEIYAARTNRLYKITGFGDTSALVFDFPAVISSLEFDSENNLFISFKGHVDTLKAGVISNGEFTNLTANMMNIPCTDVFYDEAGGLLYLASDLGIFTSSYPQVEWKIEQGIPPVIVNELEYCSLDGNLYAGTFGRGVWVKNLFPCQAGNFEIEMDTTEVLCGHNSVIARVLNPQPGAEYLWSNGAKGITTEVKKGGEIYASYITENGCSANSNLLRIKSFPAIYPKVSILGEEPVCYGDSIRLGINFKWADFFEKDVIWENGAKQQFRWVKSKGPYSYKVTLDGLCEYESNQYEINFTEEIPVPKLFLEGNKIVSDVSDEQYSYVWYRNGNRFFPEGNHSVTLDTFGIYKLELISEFNCRVSSELFYYRGENFSGDGLKYQLSPVPSEDAAILRLFSETEEIIRLEIYDLSGRLAYRNQYNITKGLNSLDMSLSNISQGPYYIIIRSNAKVYQISGLKITG
jgi:photosystem II stability/assembly factor-like uncharacterized protein